MDRPLRAIADDRRPPQSAKFYGGHFYEVIAVGRPIVSWATPIGLKTRLYSNGTEIVLFEKDDPKI